MLRRLTALAPALLLLSGCASDYAGGYAPDYPPGYDGGIGSGDVVQPGDLFGGQNVGSVELFYGPLANFGRWVDTRFGYAFVPAVQQGWRPYVNGRWGDNRLWISSDPWGWATDHYGRWGFDDRIGWVWVPGTEWAPSWVAWREDENVAGWAPIPPGVSYSVSIGFGGGYGYDDWNSWYAPSWVWVPRPYLYRPGFGNGPLPWQGGRDYWRTSQWQRQSGWNGRPGYGGWNRPGSAGNRPPPPLRPGEQPPGMGRPPGLGDNWQGRPRPDGNDGQWQGRPRRPGAPAGQPPRGNVSGEPPEPGQPQYQPRTQPPQNGYRGERLEGGYRGRPPQAGIPGQQPASSYRPPTRAEAVTATRGGPGAVGGGNNRPAAAPAPPPRADRPAQRPPAPARESRTERPD